MKASIRSISKITGFSPATVSNALNKKKGVNEETSKMIFKVADELGYVIKRKITKIKLVLYKRNGSIIDNSPFFTKLLKGVESEGRKLGYDMMICNLDKRSIDFTQRLEELLNDITTGVIVLGTEALDDDFILFENAKCPLVILDSWCSSMKFNGVLINNADSAQNAVEFLINKGHKEIGYLKGNFRINAFESREYGYQRAHYLHKLKLDSSFEIVLGTTMNKAYKDMFSYLENNPKLPTAFFADNDMIALGAMKALIEKGYRIPEDVSIIGFDNLDASKISTPGLTTIKVFKQEMGEMAVRRLDDIIRNDDKVITRTEVCTRFIERKSVLDLNIK